MSWIILKNHQNYPEKCPWGERLVLAPGEYRGLHSFTNMRFCSVETTIHYLTTGLKSGRELKQGDGGLRKKRGAVVTKEEKSYENIKIWRKQSFSVLR